MSTQNIADNIYSVGTTIAAKIAPDLKLIIRKYYQRIYYCSVITNPDKKQLVYFEHELIPPSGSGR